MAAAVSAAWLSSKNNYQNASHLFPNKESNWITKVETCSGIENNGISNVWEILKEFKEHSFNNGWIKKNRSQQNVFWFHQKLDQFIKNDFLSKRLSFALESSICATA